MSSRALVWAFMTVLIWGSAFAAIRASLLGGYPSGHLVLTRFLVASSLFLVYALWPGVTFRLPKKEDWLKLFILGVVGISVYHIGVSFGQQTVSAGVAGMLIGSSPIFTALIAFFILKERLGRFGWLGMGIGFLGMILIALGASDESLTISRGAWLILMSALATSIFFVYQKPFLARYKPIELTAYVTWAGLLPLFIFTPGLVETIRHASLEANLAAIYVGIFPAAIAYVTWAIALSMGNASSVSSILYLEPLVAIMVAWIWLQEWPSTLSLLGGIIALCGVLIVNIKGQQKENKPVIIPLKEEHK